MTLRRRGVEGSETKKEGLQLLEGMSSCEEKEGQRRVRRRWGLEGNSWGSGKNAGKKGGGRKDMRGRARSTSWGEKN